MRRFLILICSISFSLVINAQGDPNAQWIWMGGANTNNQVGVYGTKGTANASNKPGGRYGSVTWTDASGNFWLFGGFGLASNATTGRLNDLWKYNPYTNLWTWVSGNNFVDQFGVYGTQGSASVSNIPGARQHAIGWMDASGNFWVFGGDGFDEASGTTGFLNDLWKYDPSTNEWAWMNGDKTINPAANYGVLGTPAATNKPSGRHLSLSWLDADGNAWIFGGHQSVNGFLNDFWKYNLTTNEWTWMNGDNLPDQNGVYGVKGTPSVSNKPGGREGMAGWKDDAGNFWLFGGLGFDNVSAVNGYLNDLWKFDPTGNGGLGIWTWMNGDNVIEVPSVYGVKGTAAPTNKPGGRAFIPTVWKTGLGTVGLIGGFGFGETSTKGYLNDFWRYNPTTNEWTWMMGDKTINNFGVYGSPGVPGIANKPGGRRYSASWMDLSGDFWFFGGDGYAESTGNSRLNDLWKISYLVLPVKYESFIASKILKSVELKWVTSQELNSSRFEIQHSSDGINYKTIGVVAAAGNTSVKTYYNFIHNDPVQGVNYYRLKQVDIDEKVEYSEIRKVNFEVNDLSLFVTGNPFNSTLSYKISSPLVETVTIRLTDMTGRAMWSTYHKLQKGINGFAINTATYPSGIYLLSMSSGRGLKQVKVVKQ